MTSEKQQHLLTVLEQQLSPVHLSTLLTALNHQIPERTLRRWLSQYVSAGLVTKTGEKRNTTYAIRRAQHASLQAIHQPLYQRKPVAYNTAWVHAYRPNIDRYLPSAATWTWLKASHQTLQQDPAGTYARKIYHRLLIDLSYHSSRLEGNTYSLLETEKLLIEGIASTGKLDEEKIMILNHKEAIRHLIDHASTIEVSYDEVCTLHYLLADGLLQPASAAGQVRAHAVRVHGSTYMTLEGRERLSKELRYICETAQTIEDPYEQSFFLLVHIAYLQAFADVNKRTARLSANIPLIKHNLVPLSFNYIDKNAYISAMIAIYECNDVAPLADIFASSYRKTAEEYAAVVDVIAFDEIRIRYRSERRKIIRHIILEKLTGSAVDDYLLNNIKEQIPEQDQPSFIVDVKEDLALLSPQRLAGLGVTKEEWLRWKKETEDL